MTLMGFQRGVTAWILRCFGRSIAYDLVERNHRFLEEALELVQATGTSKADALQLVNYVYSRPKGELAQEIGGVCVTLAALCNAYVVSMDQCAIDELARCWHNIDRIREKQQAKPQHSPLPE